MISLSKDATEALTFEVWCSALDSLYLQKSESGFFDSLKNIGLVNEIVGVVKQVGGELKDIGHTLKVEFSTLVKAFKNRELYQVLKMFKFNLGLMLRAVRSASSVLSKSLIPIFTQIQRSKVIQGIRAGTIRADDFLNAHPILRKITGPVLAGILLWMWLNSSFIGDVDFDLNLGVILAALGGSFCLADLFTSPAGLAQLSLLVLGLTTGLSVVWLGKGIRNLVLALVYTGTSDANTRQRLKKVMRK